MNRTPEWMLFWCTTEDHDEDWFVVAKTAAEAASFHEDEEGYDEGDATAELVCVLPASEQAAAAERGTHWPTEETLLACGAELLPNIPQDGGNALRRVMGSGARVVRIGGRTFGEGDIVANAQRNVGKLPH
jgi:hypothetical protein